ncbi:hypothetical protein L915_15050 [Phytophthora nicotianae]|uniref:Uncharacterized protein n=2 Tax=Phytophthora nicotianae TaxID=4792 RepID=V9ELF1_PHYNI|nr:hypothetical protein F443_15488 [Phytophthora nicotianae P1569]ETK79062.1 hypothetical protein L915_15050 [Phytophthora nicotianae]ETL32491.1 hypothetical protein L916_14947 [Phytophthora nicotianae]ETM38899.1 hypothetical protein L914_14898 [Phytophthora nicotianae]
MGLITGYHGIPARPKCREISRKHRDTSSGGSLSRPTLHTQCGFIVVLLESEILLNASMEFSVRFAFVPQTD